ncbi:MAG: hypothetical protein JWM98_2869, partial [Thermoleophilia bacterium]|nr:hypothetical protein [Thermoleophilia bacterium]
AAAQITGAGIKDGTVTTTDIADGRLGVQGRDVRDGSLGVVDLSAAARAVLHGAKGAPGAAGARGPAGAVGPRGATGDTGPSGRNAVAWGTNTLPQTVTSAAPQTGATASTTLPAVSALSITAEVTVSSAGGATPDGRCYVTVGGTIVGIGSTFRVSNAGALAIPIVASIGSIPAGPVNADVRCESTSALVSFSMDRSSINLIGIG